jgi:hypothetical protein
MLSTITDNLRLSKKARETSLVGSTRAFFLSNPGDGKDARSVRTLPAERT